jgi:signal peptidase II
LRYLVIVFLPVLLVPVLDLLVNQAVLAQPADLHFSFISIHAVANRGIIGGYFSDSAKPIFQIPMVTLGFFLLTLLYFIQLFAPIKSTIMRVAISLFFGGIFANVVDRVVHGYVVDYLVFNFFGGLHSPALNLADLVQYVGIAMIFIWQFFPSTYDAGQLSQLWVSRQFQQRYTRQLVILGFFLVLVLGVLNYMFVKVALDELSVVAEIKAHLIKDYLIFFFSLTATFMLFLYLVGKALSAYVANPILKFDHYLNNLSQGKYGVFQIDEPEFSYLEKLSDGVRDHLMALHDEIEQLKTKNKLGSKK